MPRLSYDLEAIYSLPKIFRLNLINSISGFKSANLIGSIDGAGNQNLAIFSSVVHLGSNPPFMGMVLRPTTVPRHTYENILETGYYTINHVHASIIQQAHQTSAKYPDEVSEFDKTGLNPEFINDFKAPYVKESGLKMGMSFQEEVDIKSNGTKMIVGRVEELHLPESAQLEDGSVDLGIADTVAITGLDTYWNAKKLDKFPYARP